MTGTLYDDTHVTICRMLDRRHNNPLEDRPWPLLAADTTGRYRDHWAGLLARLETRREAVAAQVGPGAVDAFAAQIRAILAAVDGGEFGHLWAVMEAAT